MRHHLNKICFKNRILVLLLVIVGLASGLFAGCTSAPTNKTSQLGVNSQGTPTLQAGLQSPAAGIPPPSDLKHFLPDPRVTSYVPADLVKTGDAYSSGLPSNHIQKNSPLVEFDPSWNGSPDTTDELAYCMYAFDIPDYDRNAQVRYTWGTAPAEISDAWIGLANWDDDSWDWYVCDATGILDLPEIEPYFAFGGGMLLCVTMMGTDNSSLTEVKIGSELPLPSFTPVARHGFSPVSIIFDAAGSTDPDGTVAGYSWDLDGNGTFEVERGGTPTLEHNFTEPGVIDLGLQVTDNDGVSASTTGIVAVAEPFRRTWGLGDLDIAKACVVDSAGNIYLAGTTSSTSSTGDFLLAKFNALGQFIWARAFDGSNHEGLDGIVLGADNSLYVCGNSLSYGGGNDGVIQKWTTDGELVWSKRWGGGEHDFLKGLVLSGEDVFATGQTLSYGQGDYDVVLMRVDADGNLVWDKTFGGEHYDIGTAIVRKRMLLGSTALLITGATVVNGPFDVDVLYLSINMDGDKNSALRFGNDREQMGYAISPSGQFSGVTLIAGYTSVVGGDDSLLLAVGGAWQKKLHYDQLGQANAIYRIGDEFLIGGQIVNNGTPVRDSYLLRITSAGTAVNLLTRDASDGTDYVHAMSYFSGGVVVAGQSSDATGDWQSNFVDLSDTDGGWYTVQESIAGVNATYSTAAGVVIEITDGVLDTGGGSDDLYFELRQL